MPEHCPHCGDPITSFRRHPEGERAEEVWRCADCDEEWRHPEETVLNKDLDFSATGTQISRRESDSDSGW